MFQSAAVIAVLAIAPWMIRKSDRSFIPSQLLQQRFPLLNLLL
jgi:hypothetical protein